MFSQVLRVVLIFMSVCSCYYVLKKIRKSQMQIEDSLFWILFSFGILVLSIFPQIADIMAKLLGVGATVNFVFLLFIFILLFKIFVMSIKISVLENKIISLAQRIAINDKEVKSEMEKLSEKAE